jgi:hypothetical protein
VALPSSLTTSFALIGEKLPRKVPAMYFTAKPAYV